MWRHQWMRGGVWCVQSTLSEHSRQFWVLLCRWLLYVWYLNLQGKGQLWSHTVLLWKIRGKAHQMSLAFVHSSGQCGKYFDFWFQIRGLNLRTKEAFLVNNERNWTNTAIGIAYDAKNDRVFWTVSYYCLSQDLTLFLLFKCLMYLTLVNI